MFLTLEIEVKEIINPDRTKKKSTLNFPTRPIESKKNCRMSDNNLLKVLCDVIQLKEQLPLYKPVIY